MSMTSSQCDELRNLALWLDDEFYDAEASKVRQAADTILELRGDLQRANEAVQNAEHDESMAWDRVRKAEAENAKLRELVRKWYPHMLKRVGIDALTQWGYMDLLRELGIEVSDV